MISLFGKEYTKSELLARVGDISQIGGVRLMELGDGPERGVRVINFRTGTGLAFNVLVDRGFDISTTEFKGQPVSWRSSAGDVSPSYFEPEGLGFLRSIQGGLFFTAGLTYAGAPTVDDGKTLGLHGRASNLPASHVCMDAGWDGNSYIMWAQGRTRETSLFGENVELSRRITAKLGESKIWVHDKVTNLGFDDVPHQILYHCNIGFPIVDDGSKLVAPVKECKPRDAVAAKGTDKYAEFPAPQPGWQEQVFYLDMAADQDGRTCAAIINPHFNNGQGFGVYVRYSKDELPRFVEWKQPGEGAYIVGMEPSNCWVEGRDKDRARGTLEFLKPGECREYNLEFGVLSSQHEITDFEKAVKAIIGK